MSGHTTEHDLGLAHDLATLNRRRALALLGGLAVAACTPSAPGSSGSSTPGSSGSGLKPIPDETAGPFPGDGSNGPNVLTESGIVRSDVRSSFGGATGTARGVPLTITLTVRDTAKGGAPYAGAAVYIWQCDGDGNYSMYSDGVADQNYLRGVQETDGSGKVTFTSVYPGAYPSRWPHVHFEVYPDLVEATKAGDPVATSQLAFPKDVCDVVYAAAGYERSAVNLAKVSLDSDLVFRDGHDAQLAVLTGDVASGYAATLEVPV
ncbi:intradiol ring-cleavage dioxygenase [Umezawaea endophytica]|uniref:Intradiol ring-cleavage dioxygenase n=1 Tax=Umezawaea endophytica TaxID=1654476 RepID=A0A9X2VI96_9PSEU|nr:intradiol ring-cleavage dioxygenase [Umezawaea endophytica]MCS7477171.1 intradiol ring-cleavage dioxygenase [Umezawaea endophytica]